MYEQFLCLTIENDLIKGSKHSVFMLEIVLINLE